MKVAIGMKLQSGAFGGGNQFGLALKNYLETKNVEVIDHLNDINIDIILMTDPRTQLLSCAFGPVEILNYVRRNPNVVLVQRINECDERKSTTLVNRILAKANSIMDHTIYIGEWLEPLFRKQGLSFTKTYSVIRNGANIEHFYPRKSDEVNSPIRVVTHHWGGFWEKGWDIYLKLDELLNKEKYKDKIEFHYIGNPMKGVETRNIIFHKPASGKELGDLLRGNDIYLTGSMNEPAGMHHIEGALCGMPLLYRNSGALPEYCNSFGIEFNGVEDFESALDDMLKNYSVYKNKMKSYDRTSEKMCGEYYQLFNKLYSQKDDIIARRDENTYGTLTKWSIVFECLKYRVLTKLGVN